MPIDVFDNRFRLSRDRLKRKHFLISTLGIIAFVLIVGIGINWNRTQPTETKELPSSLQAEFTTNVYTTIKDNYWQVLSEEQLSQLFTQALSQTYGTQPELKEKNLSSLVSLVAELVNNNPSADHEALLAETADLVLSNLQPTGRSRLYSQIQATELNNRVANRDTQTDLFDSLGLSKSASDAAVQQAYQEKTEEIEKTATSAAERKTELAELDRAYQTLNSTESRERYAKTKVEPTISGKSLAEGIFYLKIKQFSPTTIEDLLQIIKKNQTQIVGPNLILDLRGNFGGAIDGLPYFLGPFIGNNQYAYQFFSQGKTFDFKTKIGWLKEFEPFKRIVVLVDADTQSSAEVMAATLKKYRAGVIVGTTTKGWGTVERVFPLEKQLSDKTVYSVFLVHSLTLDEAGNPIEGVGVQPQVSVSDPNWKSQLEAYLPDNTLITEVGKLVQ
ncbi:hypothetical protein KBC89_00625 [Candidatus Woesebacteria bacterium]|nr:hypothetical protein [Candidatus Woesebacteria bacterium]